LTLHETGATSNPELKDLGQGARLPELQGPEQGAWLDRLEVEHDNLRAALEWSRKDTGGAELGLRLAGALYPFWYLHGHWSEGRLWLERALAENSDAPWSILRRVLRAAARLASEQGDYARATALCKEGLARCRQTGDRMGLAWFLSTLGLVARDQGQYKRAAALCEEGLILSRDLGDKQLVNMVLANLGSVALYQGDYERATAFYKESYALSTEIGGVPGIAYALRNLGLVAYDQGIYQQASAFFAEGLTKSQEVGNRWLSRECLESLAWVACAHGHYEHSARLLGAAEALRETFGPRRPPADQVEHERRVASAKVALGETVFEATWAEGRAMTLEQAIEYALAARRNSSTV
jgi:tetratricopeptide (TPR) repeat protein